VEKHTPAVMAQMMPMVLLDLDTVNDITTKPNTEHTAI